MVSGVKSKDTPCLNVEKKVERETGGSGPFDFGKR